MIEGVFFSAGEVDEFLLRDSSATQIPEPLRLWGFSGRPMCPVVGAVKGGLGGHFVET